MIARAQAADAAAMARIHAEAFPRAPWSAEAIGIQLALPGYFGFVAGAAGMVLARTISDEAEILTLGVVPGARRAGLGRTLLGAAMAEAKNRGARAMFLEVACGNHAAGGLYATAGFTEVGRRAGYYADGTAALVLRAPLRPPPCESATG